MGRILAHGLGGRSDLPVPMWLAQYGAAVALVFSFAALRTFWRTPRLEHAGADDGRPLPAPVQRLADAPATRAGLRALGLALAGVTLAAAASLAVFAWLELVYADASPPQTVLTFLLVYGLAHLGASMVYGQAWFARGDGFEVYSTLLPIAVGYTLAHYFSLLVLQGQNGYIRASDPFGQGWDLFGTATWVQNPLAVSTATIALVQVAAIVAGHMVGVVGIALLVGT